MRYSIVQPKPDADEVVRSLFKNIAPGSVAVAHQEHRVHSAGVLVHYEGGVYERSTGGGYIPYGNVSHIEFREPTQDERIDYAKIAAGRLHAHYPTTSRFFLPGEGMMDQLEEIGYVDVDTWEVHFRD